MAAPSDVEDCREQTLRTVQNILVDVRKLDSAPRPSDRLVADLGLTSFDMMVLSVEAEDAFGIAFDFGLAAEAVTVADLCHAIDEMAARQHGDGTPSGTHDPDPQGTDGTDAC
jgi:acyl carrier protein